MRKGKRELYDIEERVRRIKHHSADFKRTQKEAAYDRLKQEAGGLYTLLRKLKRDKKIVF